MYDIVTLAYNFNTAHCHSLKMDLEMVWCMQKLVKWTVVAENWRHYWAPVSQSKRTKIKNSLRWPEENCFSAAMQNVWQMFWWLAVIMSDNLIRVPVSHKITKDIFDILTSYQALLFSTPHTTDNLLLPGKFWTQPTVLIHHPPWLSWGIKHHIRTKKCRKGVIVHTLYTIPA